MANINLNVNAIYSLLDNMIISQQTFTDPVSGLSTEIVDSNRVDGTLFGDQKRYTSVDMIHPVDWTNDSEATNLLALKRNKNVKTEAIILDKFKMFKLTTDAMLTKQAFMSEGNFSNYNAVQLSMIRDGKKAYDVTTFDVFLGTHATQPKTITVPAGANEALVLSQGIANILDDMSELSRDYNANKFLRAFSKSDVSIVFNKRFLNAWKYLDLPIVFHKDGILADHKAMNARYFGHVATSADAGSGKVINASNQYDATKGTLRFTEATNVTLGGEERHFYAGDEVPTKKLDGSTALTVTVGASSTDLTYDQVYVEDADIVGVIVGNGAIPFMSASENSTAFWNPQSLTTTNFLIWGHNTLKALGEKPYIVIKKA